MHAPVLVTPPGSSPVLLADAKAQLRVDHDEENGLIQGLIDAAVGHLDGWTGILGRALAAQTWRQDFDRLGRCLRLPIGPVISITSIAVRDADGVSAEIDDANYSLQADAMGSYARFVGGYSWPSSLYETAAVAVTYRAGYADQAGASTVPPPIRQAIMMLVAHWYQNREGVALDGPVELPLGVKALLAPWRRVSL